MLSPSAPIAPPPPERTLIEDARARLKSGDATGALARLGEHAANYPDGQLAEDREALAVQALVHAGQYDAAWTRAAALRARWPNSVFLPAVDATLESIR
jgi:outer membrane protein assembly factor BamD (BamD/ComL family)